MAKEKQEEYRTVTLLGEEQQLEDLSYAQVARRRAGYGDREVSLEEPEGEPLAARLRRLLGGGGLRGR